MSNEEPNKGTQMDLPGLEDNLVVEPVVEPDSKPEPIPQPEPLPVESDEYVCPRCDIGYDCGRSDCAGSKSYRGR